MKPVENALRHVLLALCAGASIAASAATIEIVNLNEPGVGFNDPTPAVPVGGNEGLTLGEQRLNVFKQAARIWGRRLQSDVRIQVLAAIEPLDCDNTGAVLGAAGPIQVFSDFPNAPRANTWYPVALANKIARRDLAPGPIVTGLEADIVASFNSELGKPGCLPNNGWYLGLDANESGGQINFITTVLHEMGHGLGFLQATVDEETGARLEGLADVWEQFLFDNTARKTWLQMSDAERAASAVNPRQLAWNGFNVRAAAGSVLERGVPELYVAGRRFDRFVLIGTAAFGAPITENPVWGGVVAVVDRNRGTTACVPLSANSARRLAGNVALIDRGGCDFTVKARNAQDAGAVAVIIADNVAGSPPPDLAGSDPTIRIPVVRVTQADGAALRATANAAGNNPFAGAICVLFKNPVQLFGADRLGRPLLYTPSPYEPGSSVSHYDTSARPSLLMEPFDTGEESLAVSAPRDLTLELLRDIGW